MVIVEDATAPLLMAPGAVLYRGLSAREQNVCVRDRCIALTPRRPIEGDAGIETILRPTRSRDHVLDIRRDFVSLSLERATAIWYASHEALPNGGMRKKNGILVTVLAPEFVRAEMHGDRQPAVWIGEPGPVLVDPRYILALDDVDAWIEGRSRSRRDHEVLLAAGTLSPIQIELVTAHDCTPGVVPWAMTGMSNRRFR